MQCPKCKKENFETDKPCPQCGFQGDPKKIDELGHIQWLLNQMDEWDKFNVGAAPDPELKKVYALRLRDTQVELGLRQPPLNPEEVITASVELAHLETLFEKVDEWRNAGYFTVEMETQDPVKAQRVRADELRQRLEEYPRPELSDTDRDRLKTVNFLLDNIDLIASRQWFKSKKEIEKVVAPIMAMMVDVISGNEAEVE